MIDNETRLEDVADKVINLEEVLFPKDKVNCLHIALSSDFFLKTKDGCIMQCGNCEKMVEHRCPCTIGETLRVKETGELFTVLACDAVKMKASGKYD